MSLNRIDFGASWRRRTGYRYPPPMKTHFEIPRQFGEIAMSIEAVDLIAVLRLKLNERVYSGRKGQRGPKSWRYKYTAADLAPLIDAHAAKFHAQRLSDSGFRLVPIKREAA